MSYHCCEPCRATWCRTHSVAADFCNFRDVAGVSRYTPHSPSKRPCRTYLATHCQRYRGSMSKQTWIALHVSQLHCLVSRYTVPQRALLDPLALSSCFSAYPEAPDSMKSQMSRRWGLSSKEHPSLFLTLRSFTLPVSCLGHEVFVQDRLCLVCSTMDKTYYLAMLFFNKII